MVMFSRKVFLETPALLIRMSIWNFEVEGSVKWDLAVLTGGCVLVVLWVLWKLKKEYTWRGGFNVGNF